MDFHTSKSLKYVPDLRDMIIFNPKFHFFFLIIQWIKRPITTLKD